MQPDSADSGLCTPRGTSSLVTLKCLALLGLLFGLSLACGCSDAPTASVQQEDRDEGPTRGTPTPFAVSNIDDILARDDYPEAARKRFEQMKAQGRTEVIQREIDAIIRMSLEGKRKRIEVTSKYSYLGTALYQPSLSTFTGTLPDEYPKNVLTRLEFMEGRCDFIRMGVDHFATKNIYQLSDEDRKLAIDFMNSVLDQASERYDREAWQETASRGEQLQRDLKEHLIAEPMFNFCLAIAQRNGGNTQGAGARFEEAVVQFAKDDYPTRMAVLNVQAWRALLDRYGFQENFPKINASMMHWIRSDFRARGTEQRYALEMAKLYIDDMIRLRDWPAFDEFSYTIETSRTLPRWFRSMALGSCEYSRGYHYRGSGFANTVTEEGWIKFGEHMNQALPHFREAYQVCPSYPESAESLISLARSGYPENLHRGGRWLVEDMEEFEEGDDDEADVADEADEADVAEADVAEADVAEADEGEAGDDEVVQDEAYWFAKAIEHEFDYMPAYTDRLFGLMPRWGGSVESMLEFSRQCAATKRYDTEVPFLLVRCLFMLRDRGVVSEEEYQKLLEDRELLDETIAVLEGLSQHNQELIFYEHVRDRKYVQTLLALFLTQAGRTVEAERVFRQLEGQHDVAAASHFGEQAAGSLEALSAIASALSAEYAEEAKELSELMADSVEQRIGNLAAIEELVGDIAPSNESGGVYFRRSVEQVRQEKAFADGETVEVGFDPEMSMWLTSDNRQIEFLSERAATYDNREGSYSGRLVYLPEFPGPRMTELTIRHHEKFDYSGEFTPGVVLGRFNDYRPMAIGFGLTWRNKPRWDGGRIPRGMGAGLLQFGIAERRGVAYADVAIPEREVRLRIFCDKNWIEVYADDQFLFRRRIRFFDELESQLVFAGNSGSEARGKVEFSDIKVKKWSGAPAPSSQPNELREHYQKVFDANPDDKWNKFWLAQALHADGDLEAALPLYQEACRDGVNKQIAGFYIGDILDRQGKRQQALQWYVEAALNPKGGGLLATRYVHSSAHGISETVNWASFRAAWLSGVHGYQLDNEAWQQDLRKYAKLPAATRWLDDCLRYMPRGDATQKVFKSKIEEIRKIRAAPKFRQLPAEIADAIEEKGRYQLDTETEPVYLQIKSATPFFPQHDR